MTEQELISRHPSIFRDCGKSPRETCMAWGIDCGPGWYGLIDEMCDRFDKLRELTGVGVVADQVKEKFGTLRFYYHTECDSEADPFWDTVVMDIVDLYDIKSSCRCESCGKRGEMRGGGWLMVRCDECVEKK